VIETLAMAALKEQRPRPPLEHLFQAARLRLSHAAGAARARLAWARRPHFGQAHALVDVVGVIDPKGDASADRVTESLQSAFKNKNTQGVILRINSPGGSPVQAGIIYDEIRRLRGIYPNVPMYAVVEDICASGGYYIAAAADKIYVDKASIIGSIGVIMDGWGFTGTMEKLGVERRALTSGENKAFLDPFSPVDEKQKRHAQSMLDEIHAQFIDVVKKGRGKRLKESPTFSPACCGPAPKASSWVFRTVSGASTSSRAR